MTRRENKEKSQLTSEMLPGHSRLSGHCFVVNFLRAGLLSLVTDGGNSLCLSRRTESLFHLLAIVIQLGTCRLEARKSLLHRGLFRDLLAI